MSVPRTEVKKYAEAIDWLQTRLSMTISMLHINMHLRFKFILTLVRYQRFYITLQYFIYMKIHYNVWQ